MPQVDFSDLVMAVQSGEQLVSFPTDTVPALAARPDRAELIFTAKQRQPDKPLILMAAKAADLWPFVQGTPAEFHLWQQVTDRYWPGALTLVLPASDRLPPAINPLDASTIGIRVPDCGIAQAILAATGPLATTSVNRSGQPPLLTMPAIAEQFPEVAILKPEVLAVYGYTPDLENADASGVPSTVAKWTGDNWQILRQGAIQL